MIERQPESCDGSAVLLKIEKDAIFLRSREYAPLYFCMANKSTYLVERGKIRICVCLHAKMRLFSGKRRKMEWNLIFHVFCLHFIFFNKKWRTCFDIYFVLLMMIIVHNSPLEMQYICKLASKEFNTEKTSVLAVESFQIIQNECTLISLLGRLAYLSISKMGKSFSVSTYYI